MAQAWGNLWASPEWQRSLGVKQYLQIVVPLGAWGTDHSRIIVEKWMRDAEDRGGEWRGRPGTNKPQKLSLLLWWHRLHLCSVFVIIIAGRFHCKITRHCKHTFTTNCPRLVWSAFAFLYIIESSCFVIRAAWTVGQSREKYSFNSLFLWYITAEFTIKLLEHSFKGMKKKQVYLSFGLLDNSRRCRRPLKHHPILIYSFRSWNYETWCEQR